MSNFKEDHEAFKMKPSISFIIPALNEEQNLATVVKEVLGVLDDLFRAYEILIFDDGSNDATGEVADRLADETVNIRYYNGHVLHKSEIIKSIPLTTDSFAYQIEALVRLLKSGYSYTEVGFNIQIRVYGKTKTFRLKNVINVITTLFRLCREINFNR